MTISPVAAPVAVAASGGTNGGSTNTDFAALVQQHLSDDAAGQGADERPGGVSGEAAAAMLEAASAPSAVPSDGLAALLAGLLAGPAAVGASGPGGTSTAGSLEGVAAVAPMTTSGGTAPGAGLPDVPPGASAGLTSGGLTGAGLTQTSLDNGPAAGASSTAATSAVGMTEAAGALAAGPASAVADGENTGRNLAGSNMVGASGDDILGDGLGGATAVLGDGAQGGDAASVGGVTAADGTGGSASASSGGGVNASGSGGIGAMASGAVSGTAGDASNAVTSNPITDQVFGQVTRLVSRGDGTHRLTLRLHPADLGEVKVVLTVKDGAVDVTLSAGAAARDALREGSPQLRALLELAGATTGQVTVRDLATGAVTSSTNAGQQQPAGTGADQQRSPHPDAAWADGTADGSPDGGADGQTGSHDSTPPDAPRAGGGGGPATAAQHGVPSRTATRLDLNI